MAIKVALTSLGCAKNLVDAERILYKLYNSGFSILTDVGGADVMVVNTCAFIDDAKQEGIDTILEYAELKKEGRLKGIVVTGCMAQRYADELKQLIPEVNCIVSPGCNGDICEAVKTAAEGGEMFLHSEPEKLCLTGERIRSTPDGWAYLKIADGCDNRCSYCTIPFIRGAFRSVPMEDIICEANELADGGVSELEVIAQDITRYGEDIYGEPKLCELIEKLCEIEKIRRVRLLYLYPDRIDEKLLDTIAVNPKVCRYLDIPIQHADAGVLRDMNRKGDAESLLKMMYEIRQKLPDAVLRTTVMVGFPGEDKAAFETLLNFVKKAEFDRLGCFIFSPQENTPAAALQNPVCSPRTAERRMSAIMNESALIMQKRNKARLGKEAEVLVEGFDKYAGYWFGRTELDAPEVDGKVFFKAEKLLPGDYVRVRLTRTQEYDIIGELIK